ncbi:MAG: protein kinase, partial [Acidobacteriota bacterium]
MIGRTLGHYRIVDKLGEGGMGAVYVAEDTRLQREVALKLLPEGTAEDAERLRRFEQEARAVAALNHPNIVHLYSVEQADGLHFITMELVRGKPLTELLEPEGLRLERLLELAVPLADAVAAAHKRGIIHRDLKPDNVMIGEEGRLKVLDFGLAKLDPALRAGSETAATAATMATAEAMVTREGTILGTVAYMSPEQAQGKPVDARSDVFSLGILLYEMATGRRPFEGDNHVSILSSILRDDPRPVTDSRPELPRPLGEIVRRCLHKQPADRYADATALRDDLERLRAEVVSGASSLSLTDALPAARSGKKLRWAAVVVLVLALLAIGITWTARRSARRQWARNVAIPKIQELREQASWLSWGTRAWEAHELASEAAGLIGDDPSLVAAWGDVTREAEISSEPAGAEVWGKPYTDPNGAWRFVGRTPLEAVRLPRGLSRLKIELAGRRTEYDALFNIGLQEEWIYTLEPEGSWPAEMVFVPGGKFDLFLPGIDHLKAEPTQDFLIDRHEVTNREF